MRKFKRLGSIFLAIVMVFSLTTMSAYAAEVDTETCDRANAQLVTYEVTSDGIRTVTSGERTVNSYIDGYNQGSLGSTYNNNYIVIPVTASGSGGMGITVKTSSSWSGYTSMMINTNLGDIYVSNYAMPSNGEVEFHNLTHYCPRTIEVTLQGIPSGKSVYIQVWVYG